MNRKQQREAKRAAREAAEKAEKDKSEPSTFETEQEANTALSQTARVLRMSEQKKDKSMSPQSSALRKAAVSAKKELPKLPSMPKLAGKPKPEVPCACGCGGPTRSKYQPGHDSHHRGLVLRLMRGMTTMEQIRETYGKGIAAAVETTMAGIKAQERAEARAAKKGKAAPDKAVVETDTDEGTADDSE